MVLGIDCPIELTNKTIYIIQSFISTAFQAGLNRVLDLIYVSFHIDRCHGHSTQQKVQELCLSFCAPRGSGSRFHDLESQSLAKDLHLSPSETSFEGFVEAGELSGRRSHHLSSVSNKYFC